jgi:hypothetical protein
MMMSKKPPLTQTSRRWYQKDKNLLLFISKLQKMPISLMETYCKCVIDYTMELCQADNKQVLFIESGSQKHQALIKSFDKKRWFDKNPFSYRAFNALFLLGELRRNELITQLIHTQSLLQAYHQRCLQCEEKPSMEVLGHLLLVCVKHGEHEALLALQRFETQGKLGALIAID